MACCLPGCVCNNVGGSGYDESTPTISLSMLKKLYCIPVKHCHYKMKGLDLSICVFYKFDELHLLHFPNNFSVSRTFKHTCKESRIMTLHLQIFG